MARQSAGRKQGMLIGDEEISERVGQNAPSLLAELDRDRATAAYMPLWNGFRYRPAVEAALARLQS